MSTTENSAMKADDLTVERDDGGRAREMLDAVLAVLDDFNQPFSRTVAHRLILYPAGGYELSESP
jgi:hypothetical protein